MTDAELDRIEALFRNPPTACGLSEHGLALVRHIRELRFHAETVDTIEKAAEVAGVTVEDLHEAARSLPEATSRAAEQAHHAKKKGKR